MDEDDWIDTSKSKESTEAAKKSAHKSFTAYLTLVGIEGDASVKEAVGSLRFWERFAHYLVHVAEKPNGESYASGSINQLLSYVHSDIALGYHYSRDKCLTVTDLNIREWLQESGQGTWYAKLRWRVTQLIFDRRSNAGEEVCNKSASAGRTVVGNMCFALVRMNTIDSYKRRYGIVSGFIHTGRTS